MTSLVPRTPGTAPSYCCTWAVQNYMHGQGSDQLGHQVLERNGYALAKENLTEAHIFAEHGWCHDFYSHLREDLFFLLDDGMYTGGNATMIMDPVKFPSFTGSPRERLKTCNDRIKAAGWRGLALWCRDTPGGADDVPLVEWSQYAGIRYWKVDGGDMDFNLPKLAAERYPELILEHVQQDVPLNGNWRVDGRFETQDRNSERVRILRHTDVFRTYDVTPYLSVATTLDRVSQMLNAVSGQADVRALLNVEDEVYVAATLGCTMGIFRHPLIGRRPGADYDLFFNGPRDCKRRLDEVTRAVRWQRLAQPYAAGSGSVQLDSEILKDRWQFLPGHTWHSEAVGRLAVQAAPARVSRNLDLPEVTVAGEKPFVISGRFPNGAVAVCSLGRTCPDDAWFTPKADVVQSVDDAAGPYAVFGHFNSLTFVFDQSCEDAQIWGQDLAGDDILDLRARVMIDKHRLTIPGEVIDDIGLAAGSAGDGSDPGLVFALRRPT